MVNSQWPEWYSLQAYAPVPYNQGQLGSCTANAICGVLKMLDPARGTAATFEPSRLWVYSQEELKEDPGQPIEDRGADAADGCMVINQMGVCSEALMPYTMDAEGNVTDFGQEPSAAAVADAAEHKYPLFQNVPVELANVRHLVSQGEPVLLAFLVYPSFESQAVEETGQMPMPSAEEVAAGPIGGHEVVIIGYNATSLLVLNSWGASWGNAGLFEMPNQYLSGVAADGSPFVQQLLVLGQVPAHG